MARKKTRNRKIRYDALLFQHLEKVSGKLLTTYPDIVRDLIGRQSGVYALYKKDKLYYVGLARKLSGRLRAHLRDRHKGCWDTFSIYLTNNDKHMKEIESLLLQIARPVGNKVGGKPSGSVNLKTRLSRAVRVRKREEANALIGRYLKSPGGSKRRARGSDRMTLPFLFPHGARVRGERNGKTSSGRITRDGKVRVKGKSFDSLYGCRDSGPRFPCEWLVLLEGRAQSPALGSSRRYQKSRHASSVGMIVAGTPFRGTGGFVSFRHFADGWLTFNPVGVERSSVKS